MTGWSADELDRVGVASELQIARALRTHRQGTPPTVVNPGRLPDSPTAGHIFE
ncbi:MAG: hypothetical protein ACLP0L_17265 [Solirubrobacteraceae bacterium]